MNHKTITKRPVIAMTGGGSGGHITPILSVAREVKQDRPDCQIIYIGHKGDKIAGLTANHPAIDKVYQIRAGKFRRYHGEGFVSHILDWRTILFNIRDVIFIAIGTAQAWWLLMRLKPGVIFVKGGYVGVPVALAARFWRVPYITHDSDITPGLANRLISKRARFNATGMPTEFYSYDPGKAVYTGVPVDRRFVKISSTWQIQAKAELGLDSDQPVLMVIGGGLGAARLNNLVLRAAAGILKAYPRLFIIHLCGQANEEQMKEQYRGLLSDDYMKRVKVIGFYDKVFKLSAAADLIVTRAGATALSEFAAQAKACLVVPNPQLTSGHQLKNAEQLQKLGAVEVFADDGQPDAFSATVLDLLANPPRRNQLALKLYQTAKPDAAEQISKLILQSLASSQ